MELKRFHGLEQKQFILDKSGRTCSEVIKRFSSGSIAVASIIFAISMISDLAFFPSLLRSGAFLTSLGLSDGSERFSNLRALTKLATASESLKLMLERFWGSFPSTSLT